MVKQTVIPEYQRRGRGGRTNVSGCFENERRYDFDDGWGSLDTLPPLKTFVQKESAKSIIATNQSPDIPFEASINPYRGCEHGCPYCYARPSHAYMGLSPGLDFESKLFAKTNAADILEQTLAHKNYKPLPITLGGNTDPYQPIEREHRITRSLLEIFVQTRHPVTIVTKSILVLRDIDLLSELAQHHLISVALSVTTLDRKLARKMEPRASAPQKRLEALKALSQAGVPTRVMVAPIIPAINDAEIERILKAAKENGTHNASYVLLRLPYELKEIFEEWLETEFPQRAKHVYTLMRHMRDGKLYTSEWGTRMSGTGPYAEQIAMRFRLAVKRLQMNKARSGLRTDLFQRPLIAGSQMELF